MAKEAGPLWVRIKPRNEKRRNRVRRYMVFGIRFDEERGWYKVSGETMQTVAGELTKVNMRKYLSNLRNDNDDPDSPLVFDIVNSPEEARAIDEADKRAADSKARSNSPIDVTTADLRPTPTPTPAARRPGRPRTRKAEPESEGTSE